MESYISYIVYFALSIVDSVINLLASCLRLYPKFDMSGRFLVGREMKRAIKWDISYQERRLKAQEESLDKMRSVKKDQNV